MAADFRIDYLLSQGPLSDQEQVLKDLMLREQLTKFPKDFGKDFGLVVDWGSAIGTAPTGPTTGPSTGATTGGAGFTPLGLVRPGDLITAEYINALVGAVNDILLYLSRQQYLAANAANAAAAAGSHGEATVAGTAKKVDFAAADANNNVVVNVAAESMDPSDFTDIVVGNARIDPGSLVKTDTGFFFTIPKSAVGDMKVRLVAKAGAAKRFEKVIG